ncbi:hypothetical protein GCM10023237_02220 [Streptomyces coeruleoprunus]
MAVGWANGSVLPGTSRAAGSVRDRAPGAGSVSVITFGLVTLTAADGSTSTFTVTIDQAAFFGSPR